MPLTQLFLFLLSCLILCLEGTRFDTGKSSFDLNKNGPKYAFWRNETQQYLIQFKSLIEYDLDDKPVDSGFPLELLKWTETSVVYDNKKQMWNLNFSADSAYLDKPKIPLKELLIENTIFNGTSRTKLNVHLYNYTFSNPNNSLVISLTLKNPVDNFVGFLRRSYVENNASYFYVTETATVDSSNGKKLTISPQLKIEDDKIIIEYPQFTGNLHHEIDLGIGYPPSVLPWWLFSLILGITVVLLVVVVTVSIYLFLRRRRVKYQLVES